MLSIGSSASRSPKRATTCSVSWRISRSTAHASERVPPPSSPIYIVRQQSGRAPGRSWCKPFLRFAVWSTAELRHRWIRNRRKFCFRSTIALFHCNPQIDFPDTSTKATGMAPKPTRRDLLKTTATLAATSALAFDRATVAWARDADAAAETLPQVDAVLHAAVTSQDVPGVVAIVLPERIISARSDDAIRTRWVW